MQELVINEELKSISPPLTEEEYAGLEASILRNGCLFSLIVWNDIIIDGHHRYEICQKHQIPFGVKAIDFDDIYDAEIWILKNLLHCRNLPSISEPGVAEQNLRSEKRSVINRPAPPQLCLVDPHAIRMDLNTQARKATDGETVQEYAEAMEHGAIFPPCIVFFDVETQQYIMADGFHRLLAHLQAKPNEQIQIEQYFGTAEDARWFAICANKTHGLKRSNEDKRNAVTQALLHPNGAGMSDSMIAEHVGVVQTTVLRIRKSLETEGRLMQRISRIGKDGRTINTSNIGKKESENRPKENLVRILLDKSSVDHAIDEIRSLLGENYLASLIQSGLKALNNVDAVGGDMPKA